MTIFQDAVTKLTAWYVCALLAVCVIFSVPIYMVTSSRLEGGARRQTAIIQDFPGELSDELLPRLGSFRDKQLHNDRVQLLRSILVVNALILAVGTYWSYWFAKRTLQPIEDAHHAQTRFTTDASHELRTPLATMQAEIEVALRDKDLRAQDAREVLTSNLEEIARLRALSEQLLSLTRLEDQTLQHKTIALTKIIGDEIKHLEKRHGIAVAASLQKNINLYGDEALIRQLLTILIDNAVKYSGKQPPRIAVSLTREEDEINLAVTDHGIGIKASELEHIFNRFYRGANATRQNTSGHGLGLAIAQQIVQAHDGVLDAESTPSSHTTFTATFPGA